jgi:hypothetical protein
MMRRWAFSVCAVVAVVAASISPGQASTPLGHRTASFYWGASSHPALDSGSALLYGVTAVSADDVWAVGVQAFQGPARTLVEHWDGTSWSVVPSPNPVGSTFASLYGVDALSANNVWAVGLFQRRPPSGSRTLIEHWNGTSWHRVPSPNPSTNGFGSILRGVSAVSADDVWAVGYDDPPGPAVVHPVAMRWNGGSWSTIRTPVRQDANRIFVGVSAANPSSGWAVGSTGPSDFSRLRPLVEHWNGRRWNQAPIASPDPVFNQLESVSLVAPGNVWAVGQFARFPLVEHRIGGQWHQVRPPGLGHVGDLRSVSGAGPNDVWAVGTVRDVGVLVHWDGQHWSLFHGPGASTAVLNGVTTHGTSATWAVGLRLRDFTPFEERWNGRVWTR